MAPLQTMDAKDGSGKNGALLLQKMALLFLKMVLLLLKMALLFLEMSLW
jgi:hypothetical protein